MKLAERIDASEPVVRVDAKFEDRGYFYGLIVAHRWLKFPTAQCGYNFGSHCDRARFENPQILYVAGSVKCGDRRFGVVFAEQVIIDASRHVADRADCVGRGQVAV